MFEDFGAYVLNDRFGVVIVTDLEDDTPIHKNEWVLTVLEKLGGINSGASVLEGIGYWEPTNEIEKAFHVFTNYDGDQATLIDLISNVLPTVQAWAASTDQKAVAFINGASLEIVDTPDLADIWNHTFELVEYGA
jgi:hypothetical protein